MIIVTGAAGMIGSNIIKALNEHGYTEVLAVDNLKNSSKFKNITDLSIADYMDRDDFLVQIMSGDDMGPIEAIVHQGAHFEPNDCDGKFMMLNNYEYSKELLHYSLERQIPFIYASSASVYHEEGNFSEERENEQASTMYGYSKQQFDNYVRRVWEDAEEHNETLSQVTGLRYFHVYGEKESHKGEYASLITQAIKNAKNGSLSKLESNKLKHDFVAVEDVATINLWFLQNRQSGIFNVGTGIATEFSDVLNKISSHYSLNNSDERTIKSFNYPTFSQANLSKLRAVGCDHGFKSLDEGLTEYITSLDA